MGDAGQVLWDSDFSATNTLSKLVSLLRSRYSGSRQVDKYRMELRLKGRRVGESLSALRRDIRRLMALAHPTLTEDARESIACDYYVDSLDDFDFALKVRERAPTTLDDALRISLQLEAWSKEAQRNKHDDSGRAKIKARGTGACNKPNEQSLGARINSLETDLTKRFDDFVAMTKSLLESQRKHATKPDVAGTKPSGFQPSSVPSQSSSPALAGETAQQSDPPRASWPGRQNKQRRPAGVCWGCGLPGHIQINCPQTSADTSANKPTEPQRKSEGAVNRGAKGLDRAHVYLRMQLFGKRVLCLLDSSCELTLVPRSVVRSGQVAESSKRVWAANGIELAIDGEIELPLWLQGRCVPTRALVSADIEEIMLGVDWLQTHKCVWDFANSKLHVDGQEAGTVGRFKILIVEFIHDQFRQFKNGKANGDRLVEGHFLAFGSNHHQIRVNNHGLLVGRFAHGFEDLGWIGDETNILPVSYVFHGLAKHRIGLELCQVRFKVGLGILTLSGA